MRVCVCVRARACVRVRVCVCECVSVCVCECVCVTIKSELLPLLPAPACDLVSLGAVEISGSGSDTLISSALRQLKALGILNLNIVNFKASKTSITVTDTSNGWVWLVWAWSQ